MVGHVVLFTLCKPVFGNQLEYCTMVSGKTANRGGGYGLEVRCQHSFKGHSLAAKWLSECMAKERKIVEDA